MMLRAKACTRSRRRRERGVALIAVLWAVLLLTVIAGGFTRDARTTIRIAHNTVENARAEALADAGVTLAIDTLLGDVGPGELRTDGTIQTVMFDGARIMVSIQDEGGKINLNLAPVELIAGLFTMTGVDPARSMSLAAAVADWRDKDSARLPDGAEEAEYRAAGLTDGPRNGPFETVAELRQVLGVSEEIYEAVLPALTIYSRRPGIDATTAPHQVLTAIPGITDSEVDAIMASRASVGGQETTPTLTSGAVAGVFARSRQRFFSIRSEARTKGGSVFVRRAIIELLGRGGLAYQIVEWGRGSVGEGDNGDDHGVDGTSS